MIREKLAAAVELPLPALTRRGAALPPICGKALAVIGMRRAGKTSYLYQCRRNLLAAGRSPNRLIYFNFEDERLAGLSAPNLQIIPDTHLRMFPEPATEPITLFLDEIQLVDGWETFVRRLLSSPAGHSSVTKFAADLKSQGIPVSRVHLYEFLAHLEDAFLLQTIPVATDSEKRRQVNPCKVYPADPALIPVFDRSGRANTGHALESAVFTELQRRRAEIAYVKTASGFEVDFLARYPDGTEELIQVCATIDDPDTRSREIRALQEAALEHPSADQTILTLESRLLFPSVPEPINVIPAWRWMFDAPH